MITNLQIRLHLPLKLGSSAETPQAPLVQYLILDNKASVLKPKDGLFILIIIKNSRLSDLKVALIRHRAQPRLHLILGITLLSRTTVPPSRCILTVSWTVRLRRVETYPAVRAGSLLIPQKAVYFTE